MIDTIIFDVGRVLVNWDYESYLKRFAFGPEKTKAITAATFENLFDFFGVFRGEGAESFYNLLRCENSAVELAPVRAFEGCGGDCFRFYRTSAHLCHDAGCQGSVAPR